MLDSMLALRIVLDVDVSTADVFLDREVVESSLTGDGISCGEGDDQSFGFFKMPGRFNGGEADGPLGGWAVDNSWWRLTIVWNDSERSIVCSKLVWSSSGESEGATKESFNLALGLGDDGGCSTADGFSALVTKRIHRH